MIFYKKPDRIDAIQFLGTMESVKEIHKHFFSCSIEDSAITLQAGLEKMNIYLGRGSISISKGDWVYRNQSAEIEVISKEDLDYLYEPEPK